MSYESQSRLETDPVFSRRTWAVTTQQADGHYMDAADPADAATARAVLRGEPGPMQAFLRLAAAGPGIADKVETPDGIDQSLILDADLLALTQANWPTVARLYFDADGAPVV